jgi:diphthine synthase
LKREEVESNELVERARKENIAVLVYGCPLFATTHMSLVLEAKKSKVKTKIIYAASVFDAIAETGLQLYKFGKISSMPAWQNNYCPESFLNFVKENQSIKAHSLILIDIGLKFENALGQLEMAGKAKKIKLDKVVVCSNLGTKDAKIFYRKISELKRKNIKFPFCIIIPGEMHFLEKEALERFAK